LWSKSTSGRNLPVSGNDACARVNHIAAGVLASLQGTAERIAAALTVPPVLGPAEPSSSTSEPQAAAPNASDDDTIDLSLDGEPDSEAATTPSEPAAEMVREFLRDGIAGFSETTETLTTSEAVRRGVLTQDEADGIARQAARFAQDAANAPHDNGTDHQPAFTSQTLTTASQPDQATNTRQPQRNARGNGRSKLKGQS
jgi:hypothetical protein